MEVMLLLLVLPALLVMLFLLLLPITLAGEYDGSCGQVQVCALHGSGSGVDSVKKSLALPSVLSHFHSEKNKRSIWI